MRKVLIISVSGIGNTVLQSPLIEAVLAQPDLETDILFGNEMMATVFQDHPRIHHSYLPPAKRRHIFPWLMELRRRRYEISVSCFPSNRLFFHILPILIGVKKRVIHSYRCGRLRTFSFLSNARVEAVEGIHDVQQNLRLLQAVGLVTQAPEKPIFRINGADEAMANSLLERERCSSGFLMGLHAGAGPIQGKKWHLERFALVARELLRRFGPGHVLIFGGPEEDSQKRRLAAKIRGNCAIVVNQGLGITAALIRHCNLFLSNDSGLMHIAAAIGVRTLGIFGPTDWHRTAPYGPAAHFIHSKLPCAPCLRYPFYDTRPRLGCHNTPSPCLAEITVDRVVSKAIEILET
ncbi:MAG: glycosyltransferase family 9 protein [Deltaproteobacteria bacterium]|nr:glycosyltransferase family 9 protein [Deltaproteobacteria bacterium]